MAKKTRTELSTLAINTNLPDNTQELITPTTERAQLTDERESVVNYKDDLGGVPNAGKFLTVAVDGESLTMVDEPSSLPEWMTFLTDAINTARLKIGTSGGAYRIYDTDGTTLRGAMQYSVTGAKLTVLVSNASIELTDGNIDFITDGNTALTISSGGDVGIGIDPSVGKLEVKVPTGFGTDGDNQVVITDGVATNPQEMRLGVNTASNYSYIQSAHRASAWADLILNPFAGNVGIGVTPSSWISTAKVLQLGNTAALFAPSNEAILSNNVYVNASDHNIYLTTNPATEYRQVNGQHIFYTAGSGTVGDAISFSPKLTIGSNWTSNLDAYEEGTWTPTLTNSSNTTISSGSAPYGQYTRVGRLITATAIFDNTTLAAGNSVRVSNLPFTVTSDTTRYTGFNSHTMGTAISSTTIQGGYARQSETNFQFIQRDSNQTVNVTSGTFSIFLTVIYAV